MKMAAKSQPKKGKSTPKKKTSKSVSKKTAATKKSTPPKKTAKPAKVPAGKGIPLDEFVSMTYLTANGVKKWLKQGRLTGSQDGSGQWMIDAANLEVLDVKRLVR